MSEHRFREHVASPSFHGFTTVGASGPFVAYPMFSSLSVAQQLQVQEVYRIAAERTREQLRRRRPFPPVFSLN